MIPVYFFELTYLISLKIWIYAFFLKLDVTSVVIPFYGGSQCYTIFLEV